MAVTFFLPTAENEDLVLLDHLTNDLFSVDWDYFGYMSAFARRSGTRLISDILIESGISEIEFIIGRDLNGTSAEALGDLLNITEEVILTYDRHPRKTFHPKVILMKNDKEFVAYIGSNNLTGGGLVTNYEATLRINGSTQEEVFQQVRNTFDEIKTAEYSIRLNPDLLNDLVQNEVILSETRIRQSARIPHIPNENTIEEPIVDSPKLLMEIRPHHNGEILLSKRALDERPDFFGWPWSGETVPKRGENDGYPQFDPKPVVRLRVYSANGTLIHEQNWDLTMVLYERKSEVRITIPPSTAQLLTDFDLLRMSRGEDPYDYHLDFIIQGSELHSELYPLMENTLPSGGKPRARKWGFNED